MRNFSEGIAQSFSIKFESVLCQLNERMNRFNKEKVTQ